MALPGEASQGIKREGEGELPCAALVLYRKLIGGL
jgi:hypothetical protein